MGITQAVRGIRNIWGQGDEDYDHDELETQDNTSPPPAAPRPYGGGNNEGIGATPTSYSYSHSKGYTTNQPTPSYGGGNNGGANTSARRLRPVPSPLRSAREKNIYTLKPKSQEDAAIAADSLKAGIAVIINLEEVDRLNAVRIIDFMSGVCYALEGHAMKLGDTIFLYTPPDFDISSDETDYAENPDFFFKDVAPSSAPQNTPSPIITPASPPANTNPAPSANPYGSGERRSWER